MNLAVPLVPKHPQVGLRVILPARISTPGQDPESMVANQEDAEKWLKGVYGGSVVLHRLGEQASGMLADRATMIEMEQLIKSGQCDLVLATELRAISRNPRFQWAVPQYCLDNDTRFILIGDQVDTAEDTWEVRMHVAALRHGMTIPEVRSRVRRKATHSFAQGGMVLKVKFGYRKLTKEEAATGEWGRKGVRIAKLPECTSTIRAMCERVLRGETCTQIADWLDFEGISPGPYATSGKWTRRLVSGLLRDPILSGKRRFRVVVTQTIFETGKGRRRRNKSAPEMQEVPELAHITPEEQEAVFAALNARGPDVGKGPPSGKESVLWNKARADSLWPGQHARCGACKTGLMYRAGEHLRCENTTWAGTRQCWNHVQVKYHHVFEKVLPWVLKVLDPYPRFRDTMASVAWEEFQASRRRRINSTGQIDRTIKQFEAEAKQLAKAIKKGGPLKTLVEELAAVEEGLAKARAEKAEREQAEEGGCVFTSREDVAAHLDEALDCMARTSPGFAHVLRRLMPEFVIQPVQALDCPQVRPRAKVTLRLDSWTVPGEEPPPPVSEVFDLFTPPVHIANLHACLAAKRENPKASLAQIGDKLSINRMTVRRALAYARLMEAARTTDPYRELHEAPATASRWCKRRKKANGSREPAA